MTTILDHFNRLTPAEAERLALLAEECGEVIQIVGKILRHGYESKHPNNLSGPTNRQMLEKEAGDVQAAVELMRSEADVSSSAIEDHAITKLESVEQWMHHQQGVF